MKRMSARSKYRRPHIDVNCQTPAQACEIDIQGYNKQKTLIEKWQIKISHEFRNQ
jgi:hypothetical protein